MGRYKVVPDNFGTKGKFAVITANTKGVPDVGNLTAEQAEKAHQALEAAYTDGYLWGTRCDTPNKRPTWPIDAWNFFKFINAMEIPDDTRKAVIAAFTDSTKDRNVAGRKTYYDGLSDAKDVVDIVVHRRNWTPGENPATVLADASKQIRSLFCFDK